MNVEEISYLLALALATAIGAAFKWRSDARRADVDMAALALANKSTMQSALDQALTSISNLNGQMDGMRARAVQADVQAAKEREAASALRIQLQDEVDVLKDEQRDLRRIASEQAQEIKRLVAGSEETSKTQERARSELSAKVELLLKEIDRLKAVIKERDAQIVRLEAYIQERDTQMDALTKRVVTLESENHQLARKEKEWLAERAAWDDERKTFVAEREALKEQISVMRGELDTLKKRGTGPLGNAEGADCPDTDAEQPNADETPSGAGE